jgi:hypothetical protein
VALSVLRDGQGTKVLPQPKRKQLQRIIRVVQVVLPVVPPQDIPGQTNNPLVALLEIATSQNNVILVQQVGLVCRLMFLLTVVVEKDHQILLIVVVGQCRLQLAAVSMPLQRLLKSAATKSSSI